VRRAWFGFACGVALVALAGCSQPTEGSPQSTGSPTSTSKSTSPRTTGSQPASSGLADTDPCKLLSSGEVTQLGAEPGTPTSVGGGKSCNFKASGKFLVSVTVRPTTGLAQLNTKNMEVSQLPKVGGHQAQKVLDKENGVCAIELVVTDTSTVEVRGVNTSSGSAEAGCPYATDAAKFIEPKLP
jgi:hypothetical protein